MAPILAHASILATPSGDTGIYIHTRSPFLTPLFFKQFAILQVLSKSSLKLEVYQSFQLSLTNYQLWVQLSETELRDLTKLKSFHKHVSKHPHQNLVTR